MVQKFRYQIFLPIINDSIINISSGAGKTGYSSLSTYCATKFGVRGFTKALSNELENIKVINVNPGMTATQMTNFKGVPAREVADVIFRTATGKISVDNGGDVDVWDYV